MPLYRIDMLLSSGLIASKIIEAHDLNAIERLSQDEGWKLLQAEKIADRTLQSNGKSKLSLTLFSHELKTLLESGLPLIEVLTALAEREGQTASKSALGELKRCVENGESLSEAMVLQPHIFPPLFIATIRSGERTGDLPQVIGRYLAYSEQFDELKRKLLSAVTYPLLLLTVGTAVVAFLLVYLVPRFSSIYEQIDVELSLPARLLLNWGVWAQNHPWLLAAGLLAFPIMIVAAARAPKFREELTRYLLASKYIGRYWHIFCVSRYCRSLALLTGGGIPLPEAMHLAGGLLPAVLQQRLAQAIESIHRGQRLSDALADSALLTPIALRLLRAGERSSDVPRMLEQAADFHDRELGHLLERFAKLAEPLLMLCIGVLIGSIVVLMYLPIFELAGSLRS